MILYAIDGERWDQICFRAYKQSTSSLTKLIRDSNIEVVRKYSFTLPAGTAVFIPNKPEQSSSVVQIGLAPWQR
ncbi:tail protein X [Photobacterium damselae subsp. damselae]|uniref:tail protein X n=1 Tax=Photobacterium damselae TaxID=38293 RepID=UPI001F354BEE|nr:tail protein X [Photobacterium damselae]UJZ95038.1 tail protein X [Photobacterium damselae subsp. damselae]UJZ99019.1 tail protein X [Photobacterium damselae subsp. damselae]